MTDHDLVIIGGGPAGLAAAINGASEGLDVLLMDSGTALGGQARESAAIENYPGFPDGITGETLMHALARQAQKFDTKLAVPARAVVLEAAGDSGAYLILDSYGDSYRAKTVLLSPGLAYRRLNANGIGQFMGRGVFYGVPVGRVPTQKCTACVVGGANSAGQAVLNLARNPKAQVKLLVRHKLTDQMSDYLVKRIRAMSNIEVLEDCEVKGCEGGGNGLRYLNLLYNGQEESHAADFLFIYIGAQPQTYWLDKGIQDSRGFIQTWHDAVKHANMPNPFDPLPYETSWPGVFAAGDVRLGSVKRIASACGEGAAALQMIHKRIGG